MTNVIEFISGLADGGAETLVKDYALLLDRQRFHVTVLTVFPPENTAIYRQLRDGQVEIMSIYPQKNLFYRAVNRLFCQNLVSWRLCRIIRKKKADVLHIHLSLLHYVAPIAEKLKNLKIFYTCHSTPDAFFGGERHRIQVNSAKKLFAACDFRIIAIAEAFVHELNALFGVNDTLYLHNGINLARFTNVSQSKSELRARIHIPQDSFVVGNVGHLEAYKNQRFVIDIFEALKKRVPQAFLLFVGSGKDREVLQRIVEKKKLEDSVYFLSHRSDMQELMKTMDVLVHTATLEGLGIVMIEAQAAGVKCVVSDTMQPDVFITDYIHPVSLKESPDAWCDVILGQGKTRRSHHTIEDFDMKNVIHELEKLYAE